MDKPDHTPTGTGAPALNEARFTAAVAHHRAGHSELAEAGYRALLQADPRHAHANNNLAMLLRATRRWDEALAYYRLALDALPGDAQIHNNLTCVLSDLGQTDGAVAAAQRALALQPDYQEAWFNLGNIRRATANPAAAAQSYRRAIRINPAMAEAYSNLGDVHKAAAELSQAVECYKAALRLQPTMPQPYVNLGETLKEQGRVVEAITVFQSGLEHHPNLAILRSNLLLALHYTPWVLPEVIFHAHRFWDEWHTRPHLPSNRQFGNDRTPDRRLRVGYVSPDFCLHACAQFIEPLLREHDRAAVEVFCYAVSPRRDGTTERLQKLADGWRSLVGLDDTAAAALIEGDRIDLLVDLSGHTADNRLLVFARRPAPVQVTWLGYPNTTGMSAMDYRLTDAVADPVGITDRWHSETLVRLPGGYLAFQPPAGIAVQEQPPALVNGHITFGSFNNNAKVTPEVICSWSAILKQVPSARLLLKSHSFYDKGTHEHYSRLFAGNGIDTARVILLPQIDGIEGHLRVYDEIDIGLDPFPYNGTTTTCEALWMGVPVVTLAGRTHVSRVGASLLTQCGLGELVAENNADYVAIASTLAGDLPRLVALRRTMRARLAKAPLLNHVKFARTVEDAYRSMWRGFLERG